MDITIIGIAAMLVAAAALFAWMFEIPVFETLGIWRWRIWSWNRSRRRGTKFVFPNDVELRYSATRYDDPTDRETFDSVYISFRLFKEGKEQDVEFSGGGTLFGTMWMFESLLSGPMPAVLVKSGGFVIVEGEGCGRFLVLINRAHSPKDVEIVAHQILVPGNGKEGPEENPLPDGKIVRVLRTAGEKIPWLQLIDRETSLCVAADNREGMSQFHRALLPASESEAATAPTSSLPN